MFNLFKSKKVDLNEHFMSLRARELETNKSKYNPYEMMLISMMRIQSAQNSLNDTWQIENDQILVIGAKVYNAFVLAERNRGERLSDDQWWKLLLYFSVKYVLFFISKQLPQDIPPSFFDENISYESKKYEQEGFSRFDSTSKMNILDCSSDFSVRAALNYLISK